MSGVALQHSPYDAPMGAQKRLRTGPVPGLLFMITPGQQLNPDVIMFNWGYMTDRWETAPSRQAGLPIVRPQLEVITKMLIAKEPQAKLLYALTSPQCAMQQVTGALST